MSDRKKGLRHIFTVGFFAATLIFVVGFFMLWFYFFLRFMGVFVSLGDSGENPNDSVRQTTTVVHDSISQQKKDTITFIPDENLKKEFHDSLFSFQPVYDSTKDGDGKWNAYIKSVRIFSLPDHKKIQTVFPAEPYEINGYIPPFVIEDMNFDGYDDFRILSFVMIRGQQFYYFWLYNPQKKIFEENKALEKTWDVDFDHQQKTITSNERGSGPFDVVNKVFTWENGKMILQHEEESDEDPFGGNGGEISMIKRINGKLIKRSGKYKSIPFTPEGQVIFNWDSLK